MTFATSIAQDRLSADAPDVSYPLRQVMAGFTVPAVMAVPAVGLGGALGTCFCGGTCADSGEMPSFLVSVVTTTFSLVMGGSSSMGAKAASLYVFGPGFWPGRGV